MMRSVNHIHFVIDGFELGSPAQQLLDRFLIGYTRDGVFQTPTWRQMTVDAKTSNELLNKRIASHGLRLSKDISATDAIVAVNPSNLVETIRSARDGITIFVYGLPARTARETNELFTYCSSHRIKIISGTEMATALRLPELTVARRAKEALIVVQGEFPNAELFGLDGVLSFLEEPSAVGRARYLEGAAIWEGDAKKEWSWPLLRAALSRTDTPQGNALVDGRVEDMAGLGLVPKLAKNPRAWSLEHEDGLRTTILVLDGVVADILVAFDVGGHVLSTQLFRAPAPMHEEFGRLVCVIDDFFHSERAPWDPRRSVIEVAALDEMSKIRSKNGY